jgi:glycosyl transferase family 4
LKTVLILAVHFPPSGGVGVIRTLKLTKYLPDLGWEPIVVSLPLRATKRVVDHSLLDEIPQNIEIHRPFFYDYRKIIRGDINKLLRPALNRIHFPDKYVQWNYFAFKYIRDMLLPHKHIDLVYTSVGPHSSMLLAHKLKRHAGIPFVVDFRDPFSFRQYALLESKSAWQSRAEKMERRVLMDADHINNVSRVWKEKYEHMYPEIITKSSLIHNGYDEDDFLGLKTESSNDVLTLGYNGTFSRLVPLDPLIKAIDEIHRQHGIVIRLNIATPTQKRKLISRYPYVFEHGLIAHKGFLPHKESLRNLCQSDVSLLILNDIEATEGMIPAKTFEYLRIQKPILLLHRRNSFLSEIITKTRTGMTVNISSHEEIVKTLLLLHKRWSDNTLDADPDWHQIRKFDRKYLTRQMAKIFDRLI